MNRLQNAWRPLLLGLVLMSVLVGVAGAVPTDQPSALSSQRQLVISAADFYPRNDDQDYDNNGNYLSSNANLSDQVFLAPVDFPAPNWVTLDKVELFAYDNNNAGDIIATIYLSKPSQGSEQYIATLDTGFAFADATDPRTWQTTAISPNVKNPANDLYVWLTITDNDALDVYGVRIWYRVGK